MIISVAFPNVAFRRPPTAVQESKMKLVDVCRH
jgi:hypothetical protein